MSRRRFVFCAFLLSLVLGMTVPATPSLAASTEWVGDNHAAARLITAVEATGSTTQLDAGLQIRLAPGWHAYWRSPGDAGIAPSIDWKGSDNLADATIAWPAPRRFSLSGLETQGYEDGVVLPLALTLAHPGQALSLHAEVDYAACKDICVPYHASLALSLPPGLALPGPEAALIAVARARVPGGLEAAGIKLTGAVIAAGKGSAVLAVRLRSTTARFSASDLFVEGAASGSPGRPEVALAEGGRVATLRVPIRGGTATALAGQPLHLTIVDGDRSAETVSTPPLGSLPPLAGEKLPVAIIGLALLGGLVLNLMPCVLPVLSLKLLALIGYAGAERRQARLGLFATAGGMIASFAVLAAALIVLKTAGAAIGWGIQFQQPWFLAGMALATTMFAASLWDWLPIALPGGIAGAIGAVRGGNRLAEAFLMGAFATLLAASCSAPFVGTALGFALARGPFDIVLVFAALGLGMAAPFGAAGLWPGVIRWLPRPGPWMGWLRRLLGLGLFGTALWLLWVLAAEAGFRSALIAGMALAALLGVLAWRRLLPSGPRAGRTVAAATTALAAIAVVVPTLRGEAVPIAAPSEAATGLWRPFDAAAVPGLVAGGRVVFVDVSAAWCLICKVNELTVLDRAPVADRLRDPAVVAMRADWTRPDPAVTAYLQSFGRFGVPLDVVYGPGAPAGVALPELLTTDAVMAAIRRAAAQPARRRVAGD